MKRSRSSEEQIIGILREADGGSRVKAVCAKHSKGGSPCIVISEAFQIAPCRFARTDPDHYILRDGLDPDKEHTLSVRITDKRNELSKGNNCRIVYFGLNGDPRTPKGVDVDGVYFDGSKGYGPEK